MSRTRHYTRASRRRLRWKHFERKRDKWKKTKAQMVEEINMKEWTQ